MKWLAAACGVVVLAVAASAGEGAAAPVPEWMTSLRPRYRPGAPDPVVDAIQLWRRGAEYLPEPFPDGIGSGRSWDADAPFVAIDRRTRPFLADPRGLDSAVQFSCCSPPSSYEHSIRAAMEPDRPAETRLVALVLTMRVHAPRSIALQGQTLRDLGSLKSPHPGLPWLLDQLRAEFAPAAIDAALLREPPAERYDGDAHLEWAARAAGVRGHAGAIPRLEALSVCDNLDTSLAAEASLEELSGERADAALAACVAGWKYDAYVRAASALMLRDRALLERTLLAATPPEKCRYWQGIFLGRLGRAEAVPILCDTVPRMAIVDGEMFDLVERLATKEHLAAVEALPDRVRAEQRDRALLVVERVRKRLAAK